MKKGELTLGKWHFKLGFIPTYWSINGFLLHFGIFKLLSMPNEGEVITTKNYKGFWLRKHFHFSGIEISF